MAEAMAVAVAGQILTGIAKKIDEMLGSNAFEEIGSIWAVKDEFQKLKDTLSTIEAVLKDAEKKQDMNHQLRDWLTKLRDAVYDADDLLADFVTEDLRRRAMGKMAKKMWVCVSDVFDVKKITEKIIESATGKKPENLEMDNLQNKLCEELSQKKYLLVLDDVWNEDEEKWWQLTSLRVLPLFIVNKECTCAGLPKLNKLNNLRGELSITIKVRVKDATSKAKAANLKDKQHLRKLELIWDDELGNDVAGYQGVRFPSWLPSLTGLVILEISKSMCQHLSPMYQLLNLQNLSLKDMDGLEYISDRETTEEISASSSFFPTLESLKLWNCPNLKGWWRRDTVGVATSSHQCQPHVSLPSFPRLLLLEISGCKILTYMPLFPNLEERLRLTFSSCNPLQQIMNMTAISSVPSASNSSPPPSKLKFLSLSWIRDVEFLPEQWLQNLASLEELVIEGCNRLKSLSLSLFMQHLTSLKTLSISNCEEVDLSSDEDAQSVGVSPLLMLVEKGGNCSNNTQLSLRLELSFEGSYNPLSKDLRQGWNSKPARVDFSFEKAGTTYASTSKNLSLNYLNLYLAYCGIREAKEDKARRNPVRARSLEGLGALGRLGLEGLLLFILPPPNHLPSPPLRNSQALPPPPLFWVGRRGLERIRSCFADIRDWVPGKDLFCKHYRENNKFFEFYGRSNKAGLFVDIAVYYGGKRRGCVMIPASLNRSGWCVFQKELDKFLSGENFVSVAERTLEGSVGGGPMAGGGQNGKQLIGFGNQRKFGNFQNSRGYNGIKGDFAITVSNLNGRPIHKFIFKLTSANLALRVFKPDGGKRVVSWLEQAQPLKPVVGPRVNVNQAQSQAQALLANLIDKTHSEAENISDPIGLKVRLSCDQDPSGSGETSTEPMVATELSMVVPMDPTRAFLHSRPVLELLAPISVASLPDREVERQIGDEPRNNVHSKSPGQPDVMDKGSFQTAPPPEDKSKGGDPLQRCVSVNEGSDSQTVSEVAHANGMHNCESELLFLPWGQSGVDNTDLGNGENNCGPLECAPLFYWVPKVAEDMVLSTVAEEGELVASKVEHSKWVSTMMNSFCKKVGFPIVKHEAQCVALFRLLEQECLEVANDGCNRRPVKAGQKGLRELRGLISTVNYDGTYSQNRGSSSGLGAVGSYKCP
uniref:Rx N-terminal domain-containing protein n=1 Tax=Quercus lobata TaxID=97700 RepID=A0A7N2R0U5_QUELO